MHKSKGHRRISRHSSISAQCPAKCHLGLFRRLAQKTLLRRALHREYKQKDRSELSEVGYKVGASIRKSLESREKAVYVGEHAKGSPKSPHIRRSHFHSYWTGSGENKELVVKWINTIFVHGNDEEPDKSTVHKVK